MLEMVEQFSRIGEENAFKVLARAQALAASGRSVLNLGIGQPDFKTPQHICEAAIKAIRDGEHGYTPAPGLAALREAIAADLARRHKVTVSPEHVLVVPGGKVTMAAAILMFGKPGVDILYPDPGFPIYRSMIDFTGAKAVPIPMRAENGFAFSARETLSLMNDRTRLIVLNSPANPTGGVNPQAETDALAAGLEAFPNVAVLSDEIYSEMTYDGAVHVSLLRYENLRERLILLDGFSKTYAMTGWRLGYALWPPALFEAANKLAVNVWSCVSTPTQYAGIAALCGPKDETHTMVAAFDHRRKILAERLNALENVRCLTPKGAFYAFPDISATGWTSKALAHAFLEKAGVAVIGGSDFGACGEGFLRLSCAASLEVIEQAVERMARFLEKSPPQP